MSTTRGSSMVEYALLIIAICFLAGIAYRNINRSVTKNAKDTAREGDKSEQGQ